MSTSEERERLLCASDNWRDFIRNIHVGSNEWRYSDERQLIADLLSIETMLRHDAEVIAGKDATIARLIEQLRNRVLPEHGGTADSMKHHWNLSHNDSLLHKEAADALARLPELERDAARYRWLRLNGCHVALYSDDSLPFVRGGADLDKSIDEVLAASVSTGEAGEGGK